MKKVFLIMVLCLALTVSYAYGRGGHGGGVMAEEDTLDSLVDTALVVVTLVDSLVYIAAVSVAVV